MCININYVYTDSMHLVSASDISLEKTQNTYENLRKKYFIFFLVGDLQVVTQSLTPGVSLKKQRIFQKPQLNYNASSYYEMID